MAFFGKALDQYAELWKAIIRPPRDVYELKDLGPTVFSLENRTYQRTDVSLRNSRFENLVCSHFEPIPTERVADKLPCVVYLHGNCSSRLEAISTLPVLLPFNITIFCFDFAGSGLSDGEYISLGYHERDDLAAVVSYLRQSERTSCIGLWGRSMGAATALLHADRDPSIAGLVVDSAFSDLKVLVEEVVDGYVSFRVPRWVLGMALQAVRNSIKQHASFDLYELTPIQHVEKAFIPALFATATNDTFIRPHHTQELHDMYAGDKNIVMIDGDHNSARSKFFMDSVSIFFYNTLQCDQLPQLSSLPMPPVPARRLQEPGNRGRDSQTQGGFAGSMRAPPQRNVLFVEAQGTAVLPSTSADEEEMVKRAIQNSLTEGTQPSEECPAPQGATSGERL